MTSKDDDKSTDRIRDSAQQIWLAGLGAFAKAQQEGSKVFEALVKDGVGVQKKTQAAAEETFTQAQARMAGLAGEFGAKASGGWGKLENIFEDRVARALEHLGIPSAAEVAALKARIEVLETQLKQAAPPRPAAARTPRGPKTAARPAAESAKTPRTPRRRTPRSDG